MNLIPGSRSDDGDPGDPTPHGGLELICVDDHGRILPRPGAGRIPGPGLGRTNIPLGIDGRKERKIRAIPGIP